MKLTIAICDDNKIALDSEAKVISDSLSNEDKKIFCTTITINKLMLNG